MFKWLTQKNNQQHFEDFDSYFSFYIKQFAGSNKAFCADTHFYMHILSTHTHLTEMLYKLEVVISQETIDELLSFANHHHKKNQKRLAEIALQQLDLISLYGKLSIIPITGNKVAFRRFLTSLRLNYINPNERALGYYSKLSNDFNYDLVLFSEEPSTFKFAKRLKLNTYTFHEQK